MTDVEPKPTPRNIPDPMMRAIRQRCGFGCVICGVPIYEYEHMDGWASAKAHVESRITLLCLRHHGERTKGLLPLAQVESANASPLNQREGVTTAQDLYYDRDECEIVIGGNRFASRLTVTDHPMIPIIIDAMPLVMFRAVDGRFMLTAQLFNEFNEPVLVVHDNQLIMSAEAWDIEFVAKTLTIRRALGDIFLEVLLEAEQGRISITRGQLFRNGVELQIRSDSFVIVNNGSKFGGNHMVDCAMFGVVLGVGFDGPSVWHFSKLPRRPMPPTAPKRA